MSYTPAPSRFINQRDGCLPVGNGPSSPLPQMVLNSQVPGKREFCGRLLRHHLGLTFCFNLASLPRHGAQAVSARPRSLFNPSKQPSKVVAVAERLAAIDGSLIDKTHCPSDTLKEKDGLSFAFSSLMSWKVAQDQRAGYLFWNF
jgi:hypothetical protein